MTANQPDPDSENSAEGDSRLLGNLDPDTGFELIGFPQSFDETGLRSREPFDILASQFVEELRRGQRPSVESYARRYPPHAERIRDCFPVLAMLESARLEKEAVSLRRNMPEKFPFKRIGRCDLLCELGRGGMGVVFQAHDSDTNSIVAMKILPWRISMVPDWQQRFEKEARTAANLEHEHIVRVMRSGQEHGYAFYIMQFVNGVGLDRVISRLRQTDDVIFRDEIRQVEQARSAEFVKSREPVPFQSRGVDAEKRGRPLTRFSWKDFAQITAQAAEALGHAHDAGVLHNDIKPANLILDVEGRVRVTDFGLSQPLLQGASGLSAIEALYGSRRASVSTEISNNTHLAGTLRYMAPERLNGSQDARGDLYSLGLTLYELCTFQPAFVEGHHEKLLKAILNQKPAAPTSVRTDLPRDLETIILNCIARDPAQRYQSAGDLLTDLRKFASSQTVTLTRQSVWKAMTKGIGDAFGFGR